MVADRYESYDAWKAVAAVGAGIAIGTMLAKPPAAAKPVVVDGIDLLLPRQHLLHAVMTSGEVVYQVVAPPAGAIITTLPAGCKTVNVNNASLLAVRDHPLHQGGERLPGGRVEVSAGRRSRGGAPAPGWRALLPVALLVVVALVQVTLATPPG